MARNVFYSFHYAVDAWRVSQIRNIGALHDNPAIRDNDWEAVTRGGDPAIENWIDGQLIGTTCTVVLIGAYTANRKWINYEIKKSWERGNGVLGVYIHGLKNRSAMQATRGDNPFDYMSFTNQVGQPALSTIARVYDPPYSDSTIVYRHIANNLEAWVEEAIRIRNNN